MVGNSWPTAGQRTGGCAADIPQLRACVGCRPAACGHARRHAAAAGAAATAAGARLQAWRAGCLEVRVDDVGRCADDVLPLLVLDEVEVLQRGDDVVGLDHGQVAQLLDADAALALAQDLWGRGGRTRGGAKGCQGAKERRSERVPAGEVKGRGAGGPGSKGGGAGGATGRGVGRRAGEEVAPALLHPGLAVPWEARGAGLTGSSTRVQ
jgi:hypothetical protein